jgi:hypothetical protein
MERPSWPGIPLPGSRNSNRDKPLIILYLLLVCGLHARTVNFSPFFDVATHFWSPHKKRHYACLSRWLFFMGQNGLSGGFFRPRIKSDATIFMHRHEKAATKRAKNSRCRHEAIEQTSHLMPNCPALLALMDHYCLYQKVCLTSLHKIPRCKIIHCTSRESNPGRNDGNVSFYH